MDNASCRWRRQSVTRGQYGFHFKDEAQRRSDRIAGDLGDANGWLSIIAAIESGAADGPQLIIDGLQSAVLRVTPAINDNNRNTDERPQAYPALA